MNAGIMLCHDCGKLLDARGTEHNEFIACPRCHASVHYRKHLSISTTWALVLSAAVLFLPANLLPIMTMDYIGSSQDSTIMDGIIYFFHEHEYGIGLIIFIASVLVPLFKIAGLIIILLSIKFKWKSWLSHKTAMFHFIEFIGRWSMLDIFVISLMGALVEFEGLTATMAAPAVSYFAAVVICTMVAAITFDPRLLWDA